MRLDMEEWIRRAAPVRTDDLDLDAFIERPLTPESLRCLRYMHDVEYHTVCYMRDLLLTPAHADPELTAFLTIWNFEEFWHGEAIAAVLKAHGEEAGQPRVRELRHVRRVREMLQPLFHWTVTRFAGDEMVATHMTWGAINEWTAQAAYGRLAALADHPELTKLLRRIMRQEGRHIDVYAARAAEILAGSRRAQRFTRYALRTRWAPVGTGVAPDSEVRHMVTHLFGGPDGRDALARIDRHIDRMPGLAGLCLTTAAADRHLAA